METVEFFSTAGWTSKCINDPDHLQTFGCSFVLKFIFIEKLSAQKYCPKFGGKNVGIKKNLEKVERHVFVSIRRAKRANLSLEFYNLTKKCINPPKY